jgi:uncharacterized membrane protein YsdA (DUF1294 family)
MEQIEVEITPTEAAENAAAVKELSLTELALVGGGNGIMLFIWFPSLTLDQEPIMEQIVIEATEAQGADQAAALEELSLTELALVGGGNGIMLFI